MSYSCATNPSLVFTATKRLKNRGVTCNVVSQHGNDFGDVRWYSFQFRDVIVIPRVRLFDYDYYYVVVYS